MSTPSRSNPSSPRPRLIGRASPADSAPQILADGSSVIIPSHPAREALIKQTYSTTMLHPTTGKTKRFHIVGYSSKNNPHGDEHSALPAPAELPLLSTLEIAPGVWPEWEKQRDGITTKEKEGGGKRGEGSTSRKKAAVKLEVDSTLESPSASPEIPTAGFANPEYPVRGPGSAPPSYAPEPRQAMSNPYEPFYYYPPQPSRSAPAYQVNFPPQSQPNERYHPYRDRPGPYPPNPSVPELPNPSSSGQYLDDRRASSSNPMPNFLPPGEYNPNAYAPPNASHSPYMPTYRDMPPDRSQYPQSQIMPYPSSYMDNVNPYYHHMNQYPQQHQPPSHQPRQPSRDIPHSPTQTMSADPSGSPKFSIASALSGEADTGRLTLPPLRVAIDQPGNQAGRMNPALSPLVGADRRELGELGKKVSL